MKLDMNNFKTGRTLVLYRAMEYRTMELKWSVVTKHETIKERVKELVKINYSNMSKSDKDEYCMDLAYAVREASLFRITGPNVEKAKKLLDKFVEERMDPETKRMLETAITSKNLEKLIAVVNRCEKKGVSKSSEGACIA